MSAAGSGVEPGSRPRLVLATRNAHKVAELRRILAESGLDQVDIVGLDAFDDVPEVPETGVTFTENAEVKARSVAESTGVAAVADDSGLCVDVLGGAPGVFSARWCGRHGDDPANLDLLLAQLADVPPEHRGASFVCAAVLALPDGRVEAQQGRLSGTVITSARGENGFGYDPIFVPEGQDRTTAQMTAQEKDAISHRGRALRALAPVIREALADPDQ
jgi:XTP/dITP diphosphohydrolase